MNLNINIVILAAGASTRMGQTKQLLPWKGGTLISHAVNTAINANIGPVTVVTGANALEIEQHLIEKQLTVIKNEQWEEGMGSSIVCGLKYAIANFPECKAVLLMLADQPLIDSAFLRQLVNRYSESRADIIATLYDKGPGVPALFDQRHFTALSTLHKDYGARTIIAKNLKNVIALDPKGKQLDVDTMEVYKQLLQRIDNP